ncbi:MAG: hypothetical protein HC854_16990 [Flavobacterium sp.]|nr:hypothetical protein [Flavobacterium sp.]
MKNYFLIAVSVLFLTSCSEEPLTDEVISKDSSTERAVTANGTTTITEQYGIYQDPNYKMGLLFKIIFGQ